ncbi:tetratricopeptide repeat protein [Parabacteroides distasonis]|uniref:tetratricopeptide repeat protein n=1 Tax=Parabacteroides distasonis TaxID=823 RepID=UPI001D09293F|nr:hypothetical protein [Parabacteroides distasonis]MCB7022909.1 hypothetical protein [Parabacteroides distasonis]
MKNNLYVFFLFFITGLMSCSHHSGLYEQAEKIMSQHPDSVLTLLSTIQDVNDLSEKDRAMYYLLLTEAENKTYVKPTSDSLITIAVEYFDKTEDWERKAKAWYYRGRINQDLGDALHAQDYYLKALREEDKIDDYALLGRLCNSISMLYTDQQVYEKSLVFQKKALKYFETLRDTVGQSFVLRGLGRVFSVIHKKDSAVFYYEKALSFGNEVTKRSIYNELGGVYLDLGLYSKAFDNIQMALSYPASQEQLYPIYLTLGELYLKTSHLDSADCYLKKGLVSTRLSTRAGAYYHLSQLSKGCKRWEEYVLRQSKYEELRDSLMLIRQTESFRREQDLFNYHQTESKLFQTTIAFNRAKINFLIVSIVAIILAIVFGLFAIFVYTKFKRKKMSILEQREKLAELLRKQHEDKILIEKNEGLIADLEKRLHVSSIAYDEKEKELITLRKQRLEIENQNLLFAKTENKLLVERFVVSDIYYRFHIKEEWRPRDCDWAELFDALDKTYNNFTHRLMGLVSKLTPIELKVSCLVKSNVPPAAIAMLIVTTPTNVSMIRKRLYEKIYTTDKGSSEKFDKFIRDF